MKKWWSERIAPLFLTLALGESEHLASCPSRYNPGEIVFGTYCIRAWVCPRTGLDAEEKRKILPCRESNPDSSNITFYYYTQIMCT
jgi:hypothetical protein